jgi:RNA polymerase sigma-70 factor (ECF subfamily)
MTHDDLIGKETLATSAIDFDAVVEQFYEPLYKFAFVLTRSASDAADLTQEAYRVLLLKGGQIREPQKVKSWLFTTLYREFLGRRRHAERFPQLELDDANDDLPCITPNQVEELDASVIVSTLQMLEEKYRAPLVMFYLRELSYKEIAEVLGIPIGTVMSRLSRGKDQLRKRLKLGLREAASAPVAIAVCPPRGSQTAERTSSFADNSAPAMAPA